MLQKQKKGKTAKSGKEKKESKKTEKEKRQSKGRKDKKKGSKSEKSKSVKSGGSTRSNKVIRISEEVPEFHVDPESVAVDDEDLMKAKQDVLQYYKPYMYTDTVSCVLETKLNGTV